MASPFPALRLAVAAVKVTAMLVFAAGIFVGVYLVARGGEGVPWGIAAIAGGSAFAVLIYAAGSLVDVVLAIEAHLDDIARR